MLVDLPSQVSGYTSDPMMEMLARMTDGNAKPERLDQGVYVTHLNFNHELRSAGLLLSMYPFSAWESDKEYDPSAPDDYGVCDNYHQIIARWWEQLNVPDRRFVICLTQIRKDQQSPEGGWRWHKWGPYIGTGKPQCEYLYDEPDIQEVFCFHILELR